MRKSVVTVLAAVAAVSATLSPGTAQADRSGAVAAGVWVRPRMQVCD